MGSYSVVHSFVHGADYKPRSSLFTGSSTDWIKLIMNPFLGGFFQLAAFETPCCVTKALLFFKKTTRGGGGGVAEPLCLG